jgi:hypothetical protein
VFLVAHDLAPLDSSNRFVNQRFGSGKIVFLDHSLSDALADELEDGFREPRLLFGGEGDRHDQLHSTTVREIDPRVMPGLAP